MKITPSNGFLLLENCETPFEAGPLTIVRENMLMQFGKVVASDSAKPGCQVGCIVFYLGSNSIHMAVDQDDVQIFLHEGQVMGHIPAAQAMKVANKVRKAPPPPFKGPENPPLVIAPAGSMN